MGIIIVLLYYGGKLTFNSSMGYVGGVRDRLYNYDSDLLSTTYLKAYVKKYGVGERQYLWYKFLGQSFEHGLKRFFNDSDVRGVIKILDNRPNPTLEVFAEHELPLYPKPQLQPNREPGMGLNASGGVNTSGVQSPRRSARI